MPDARSEGSKQASGTLNGHELHSFVERIKGEIPLCDAQRAGEELYGAPRLSIFQLLSPNELSLTRVIADLFDPNGTHGQGPLFLNEFLREISLPTVGWREVIRVSREVVLPSKRRIDLLIEGSNFIVGIENKPWAAQQYNQLDEYYNYIRDCAKNRRFSFVFISDQEEQSAHGKVEKIPYFAPPEQKSLFRILQISQPTVKSDRTRLYLLDFMAWIEGFFGDNSMSNAFEKPYNHMVRNIYQSDPVARKAVAAVLLSASKLHKDIIDELGDAIFSDLKNKAKNVEQVGQKSLFDCIDAKWVPWLIRRSSWPKNCYLALESDRWNCDKILFGVRALDPQSKEGKQDPSLSCAQRKRLDLISSSMQGGGRTSWWPWRRHLTNSHWDLPYIGRLLIESDGEAIRHPDVEDLSSKLLALIDAVDAVL